MTDGAQVASTAPAAGTGGDGTWLVSPGDRLWSIAARTLAEAWGRTPAEHQVAPYWSDLVAANRDRLVRPGDADLIVPGQELVLPAPPPPPGAP